MGEPSAHSEDILPPGNVYWAEDFHSFHRKWLTVLFLYCEGWPRVPCPELWLQVPIQTDSSIPFYILGVLYPFLPFKLEFSRAYFGANHHVSSARSSETLKHRGSEGLWLTLLNMFASTKPCALTDAYPSPLAMLAEWWSSVLLVLLAVTCWIHLKWGAVSPSP